MAGILERYYPPPTGKFAIILPWQLIFSNFSPAKTGGNGSLFIPGYDTKHKKIIIEKSSLFIVFK